MADFQQKYPGNVPGAFYVDRQCIACDACVVEAPEHFEMNTDLGHAFVKAQPKTPSQLKRCQEALEHCPVAAIGADGDRGL